MRHTYHLLNVFTRDGARLSGNPLCVFEDGSGLDTQTMQALARQFNLSETTFLLPSKTASAGLRIFTPDFEMAFAGHPTLGSAHVVRLLGRGADQLTLDMSAGVIPVAAEGDRWTLSAKTAKHREVDTTPQAIALALGLAADDILWSPQGQRPLWLDSGSDQLLVPLVSTEAITRAAPRSEAFGNLASSVGRRMAYVFAEAGAGRVNSRFFFEADGSQREDPATGSACANLGGWYLATGASGALMREVHQGDHIRRPSSLFLSIDAVRQTRVAGDVAHLGTGSIEL